MVALDEESRLCMDTCARIVLCLPAVGCRRAVESCGAACEPSAAQEGSTSLDTRGPVRRCARSYLRPTFPDDPWFGGGTVLVFHCSRVAASQPPAAAAEGAGRLAARFIEQQARLQGGRLPAYCPGRPKSWCSHYALVLDVRVDCAAQTVSVLALPGTHARGAVHAALVPLPCPCPPS